jgi:pyruvate,water dikinase
MLEKMIDAMQGTLGAVPSETAIVSGTPASPGRASGAVRVIRGPEQFDELEPGEILVAPMTAPAWTPLFSRAAAVVTDVGSPASHASVIAREYGIPAVVGCGDATARLRTGLRVTVNGSTGNVEPD